jgi:hypothetical protein
MMLHLTISSLQSVAALQTDTTQWRHLLTDDMIGAAPHVAVAAPDEEQEMLVAHSTSAAAETARAVVDYIVTVWKLRSTALNGRETSGGDAVV